MLFEKKFLIEQVIAALHSIFTAGPPALSSPGTCKFQVSALKLFLR